MDKNKILFELNDKSVVSMLKMNTNGRYFSSLARVRKHTICAKFQSQYKLTV